MNRHRSVLWRRGAVVSALVSALAGCSESSSDSGTPTVLDPNEAQAYTVSYRNQVRVPNDGQTLSALGFSKQTKARDPVSQIRCATDESQAFRETATFLGGIAWSHPVAIVKDQSYPPLFTAKQPDRSNERNAAPSAAGAADASGAAPVIERPDLVGVQNGTAVFLSKQHGLLAVDVRGASPVLSCSMKLPGEPKNFLFHGNELVVVVNARNGFNRSALLRYALENGGFRFVDAVRLEGQTIQDARLFDSTIVAYTSWSKAQTPPTPPPDEAMPNATSGGNYGRGVAAGGAAMGVSGVAPGYVGGYGQDHLGTKIIVVKWDDQLGIDYEDSLLDDPVKQDPLEGTDPNKTYQPGQLVSERKSYKSFVAASDRYVVVPRDSQKTKFSHYETYNYQVCTSYNPQFQQIEQCHVNYEQRPNPDYRPPNPTTGDYACNGKKLADCIQEAAPTVSQYIYAPVGQTCDMVWIGRCEKYEMKSATYPAFDQENVTELTIYRFENGSFTKLDSSLGKLVQNPAKPDAITFEKNPLAVPGTIANRNQLQFQNGHLYVFADQSLQTLSVAANSIAYLDKLGIAASTTNNPAIVFSDDRAMISARNNATQQSDVAMLDLSTPSLPKPLTSFTMPGTTTQLILTNAGILGPGQVSLSYGQVGRQLQKLTLFSKEAGSELDNLLLGTEYDTFETSWFDAQDDQKIRLGSGGLRLFLPYSGRHHADQYEPPAHRLNITRIENNRLVSERSFNVSDDIIRTAPVDDNHSLVFSNSAVYAVDHTTGDWLLTTLREFFTPFATYRLADDNVHARVSRVGSKCLVTTHAGDARIFADGELAKLEVPCGESSLPIGFKSSLLFSETRTGVRISPDHLGIVPLTPDEVDAMLKELQAPDRGYCYIDGGDQASSAQIEYLDSVPAKILCEKPTTNP
jgi:hypothetical protein